MTAMLRIPITVLMATLPCFGCGDGRDPLDKSCSGKPVPNCRPFEYSVVQSASLEPEGVEVGDPEQDLEVRVELATCGEDAPEPHLVGVSARADEAPFGFDAGAEEEPDAGARATVFDLLTLRDDGSTFGDAEAQDGIIDVTVDNPFIGDDLEPLASESVVLRFEPRTPPVCDDMGLCVSCRGEALEIGYNVGPRFMP